MSKNREIEGFAPMRPWQCWLIYAAFLVVAAPTFIELHRVEIAPKWLVLYTIALVLATTAAVATFMNVRVAAFLVRRRNRRRAQENAQRQLPPVRREATYLRDGGKPWSYLDDPAPTTR